jgi:acetyl esterase/lipase
MSFISLLVCFALQHVDNDIVYSTVGDKQLKLDAYRPPTPNGKVFIAIHGGGFTGGSKGADTGGICRYLSGRGFTCFDINYRLLKDVGGTDKTVAISAAITDATAAYNWVVANASTYGGDPGKIAIGGSSAGAITALYTTYSRRIRVKAVVDLWGGMYGRETDIKQGDAPLLIIHGENDKVVSMSLGRALQNRALAVHVPVQFFSFPGGHGTSLDTVIKRDTVLEHIESFLHESMGK